MESSIEFAVVDHDNEEYFEEIDENENNIDQKTISIVENAISFNKNNIIASVEKPTRTPKGRGRPKRQVQRALNVDDLPSTDVFFDKLDNLNVRHDAECLADDEIVNELDFFFIYLPESEILMHIVDCTNTYASQHNEENDEFTKTNGREWENLTLSELLVWLACVIYMGVVSISNTRNYWSSKECYPSNLPMKYMSLTRFGQIKRYLKVTTETNEEDNEDYWWKKVKYLFDFFNAISTIVYRPSSRLALDEMRVLFKGRSKNKERIKGKPIKEGYTILSVCDSQTGYCLYLRPKSKIHANENIDKCHHGTVCSNLNDSEKIYFSIIHESIVDNDPDHKYVVFMDNYFSSVKLFSALRQCGIGSAGTTRTNRSLWPTELLVQKVNKLPFLTTSGVVVNDVLCSVWVDNGVVNFMTTVHELHEEVKRSRKRPKKTSTNAAVIHKYFGDNHEMIVPIPKWIDDYNMNMGAVDISDQKRGYHAKHLKSRRNWLPLFFFYIQNSVVSSHILFSMRRSAKVHPGDFRMSIVLQLLNRSKEVKEFESKMVGTRSTKLRANDELKKKIQKIKTYVGKSVSSHPVPKSCLKHYPVYASKRGWCVYCRIHGIFQGKHKGSATQWKCGSCNDFLCLTKTRNCFIKFHNY